ncbi:MAG: exodeoxyribonuclease VII [Methylibium sp. NZG]|nr:MAG: exodeoxyribonuclease VII [Methylibium sp. NZG]KNZ34245.1 MAG: exodeoxyribonuclease VII [Methylibium sp. NZG]
MNSAPGAAPARLVWSVAALVQAVADALAARFSPCAVRGEVSGFARAASGHCYFTLKDASGGTALLRCAMFRRAAALLDFVPQDGQLVELRGRLGLYEARGELQLVVESMQRAGAGALFEQFLKLKARLEAEGLFDAARKRPIPAYPRRLGVVTSLGAAALRDVITTLARRSPQVEVLVYPSAVQGADAPASLCAALALVAQRSEVDCVILCRGGGSLEDLWAFNDEHVVRAVRAMPMPLICGVGHETDVTLADFAADLRAPTPTAAAELAAPDAQACVGALRGLAELLQRRVHDLLDSRAQRLDTLALRLTRPAEAMRRRAQRLELLAHRLLAATQRGVDQRRAHAGHLQGRLTRAAAVQVAVQGRGLAALGARLRALDPQHVLARGYAWLSDTTGRPVANVAALEVGASLQARLADGRADLMVTAVEAMPQKTPSPLLPSSG